jgi:23S rRNA G2445 N2-methylase RlmL
MRVEKGETVLDPFIGSGTLALEAQLMGINAIGTDISEVCTLISKVKTQSLKWLNPIQEEHENLSSSIDEIVDDSENKVIKEISNLVENIEIQEVRNFFLLTKLIAHSDKSRRSKKSFKKSFEINAEKMIESLNMFNDFYNTNKLNLGETYISQADVRNLKIPSSSIDGVVTSPPYSIALDYVENDKHALSALGYDVEAIRNDFIGLRGSGSSKINLYNQDMKIAYQEIDRVLKKDKYCTIIIGNAILNRKKIETVELTIDIFKNLGYTLVKNVDKIIFGLYNVMQMENILIFKKE